MARNEEKQFGRLNRLLLQQQEDENKKKNPPRPKLHTLFKAGDIKKWLPSLKRDMDFNIKQSQVKHYPQSNIDEFLANVDRLKGEYRAFVRKLRELEPSTDITPWTDRPYNNKNNKRSHTAGEHADFDENAVASRMNSGSSIDLNRIKIDPRTVPTHSVESGEKNPRLQTMPKDVQFTRIATPVLDNESQWRTWNPEPVQLTWNVNTDLLDKPLEFDTSMKSTDCDSNECDSSSLSDTSLKTAGAEINWNVNKDLQDKPLNFNKTVPDSNNLTEKLPSNVSSGDLDSMSKCATNSNSSVKADHFSSKALESNTSDTKSNLLGLDYGSDSDSSGEETKPT